MNTNPFSLTSQLALITGGGTGIGRGIAQALLDAGATVVITGRREAVLQEATQTLGNHCHYVVNDVTNKAELPALVRTIEEQHGPIDILVNNAGINVKKPAQETSDEEFERILQTNLISVFALTRACAEGMIKRRRGSIILISSMAALFGIDRVVAYGTSKTALTGLMNNLVTEYSPHNVRINTIAPGWIDSEMFRKATDADPDRKRQIVNRIAMNGFGEPSDIGHAAVFLSSEAARYITGVVLPVDGGATVNF